MAYSVRQMEETIKQLSAQLQEARRENKEQQKFIDKASKDTDSLLGACRKFCMAILNEGIISGKFSESEIKGLSLKDLLELAEYAYEQEQKEKTKLYGVFAEKFTQKKEEVENLLMQNAYLQMRLNQVVSGDGTANSLEDEEKKDPDLQRNPVYVIETQSTDNEGIKPTINDRMFENQISSSAEKFAEVVSDKEEDKEKKTSTPTIVDLKDIYERMDDLMWKIIELMGKYGLCEYPEIKTATQKAYSQTEIPKVSNVNNAITALKTAGVITEGIKVNTGLRWFYVYELTSSLGVPLYLDKFKKAPVENEIKKLTREHDNIKHGYYIKESSVILERKHGYNSVSTNRKVNTIKLPNGRRSIPDIICTKKNGVVDYFEVECGNHTNGDFIDKCNKLSQITTDIRFIVPNTETINDKIIPQITAWIKSAGLQNLEKRGINVWITTVKRLSEKKWVCVFDMSSNQPKFMV